MTCGFLTVVGCSFESCNCWEALGISGPKTHYCYHRWLSWAIGSGIAIHCHAWPDGDLICEISVQKVASSTIVTTRISWVMRRFLLTIWIFYEPIKLKCICSHKTTSLYLLVRTIPYLALPVILYFWQVSKHMTRSLMAFFIPGHFKFWLIVAQVIVAPGCLKFSWYRYITFFWDIQEYICDGASHHSRSSTKHLALNSYLWYSVSCPDAARILLFSAWSL